MSCAKCSIVIQRRSLMQHEKYYCPFRESSTKGVDNARGGRKIFRPVPPKVAKAAAPVSLSAEDLAALGPAPRLHVAYKPKPPAKRSSSSIPGGKNADSANPLMGRPSGVRYAPVVKPSLGCYGQCGVCSRCKTCRERICNGKCSFCKRCKTCREWGRLLEEGDEETVGIQTREIKRPPPPKKEGPFRIQNRPKEAPKHSVPCPYCSQWLPSYHQENCQSMPFELWIDACRRRNVAKFGQVAVDTWSVQCQHCATPFSSHASKRVHLSGCERRRTESNLPLNQFPVIRVPHD